ncbi:hypothetical protein SeMB42_g03801 [Synchytrium endobioticum]|uniref:Uncharacterized protein n=1 Tax=Synchytrium endobioticum TaxID=286115 RepID=A0A507D4G9_9FUNG|nr:hypothetical protein SeMB42_g03801 [Synchytrium endobioticum]
MLVNYSCWRGLVSTKLENYIHQSIDPKNATSQSIFGTGARVSHVDFSVSQGYYFSMKDLDILAPLLIAETVPADAVSPWKV